MSQKISMKNSTVLLWWFMYILVGILAGMGAGIAVPYAVGTVIGMIGGIPEHLVGIIAFAILLPFLIFVNFLVYKWSVQKIIHASLHNKADTAPTTNPSDPSLSQPN